MVGTDAKEKTEDDIHSAVIRREWLGGEPYLCLTDIVYMCEVSRDRYQVEGNLAASESMSRLAFLLQMVAIVA